MRLQVELPKMILCSKLLVCLDYLRCKSCNHGLAVSTPVDISAGLTKATKPKSQVRHFTLGPTGTRFRIGDWEESQPPKTKDARINQDSPRREA